MAISIRKIWRSTTGFWRLTLGFCMDCEKNNLTSKTAGRSTNKWIFEVVLKN
jgi:hypothetical protein